MPDPGVSSSVRGVGPTDMPLLELQSVTMSFGGFTAINDISLTFEKKPVYGIIGPNGAGKTTLFNILSGFYRPRRGRLLFNGEDMTPFRSEQFARRGIVRSFQITSIFPNLTVIDNVVLSVQQRADGGIKAFAKADWHDNHRPEANALLDQVGIPPSLRGRPASDLPYGRKRALELAISLAAHPKILLLDEPTAGMTTTDVSRTTELIAQLSAERTIIVVEHNLGVIADVADEIIVLQQGALLARGRYDDVRKDTRVIEAYLGKRH
ncbi:MULTISPECIES: ABC transporter ATP-binding protein [unclassified Mesorhizobium]|uniref:ABC transporter ATP-binding protein n=1 Tax=unclassified Mesorhizobium TaxID=325217 RepID=UPI00112D8573|nr:MULTISPECIES: ABC transporter ATP-binding protein [unclassified Mesorhizobium]MBZ9811778.1 ABC transporter ATP-binding protein [Mesorhizobium sp. ESP-6-2]MBZ9942994.1 ABC transporter ATP-binding protein [Mesorhizobium sp. BR1-1-13]TPM24676.1 ABC transporter ATP-binding protein [Mesorhizobium sp. B2-2-2]